MIRTSRGTISLSRLFAAETTLGLAWLVTPVPVFAQNAFITNSGDNTVSVIDTTKNTVVATIPVGKTPFGVAVSPDNKTVYITNSGDNTVSVIEAAAFTVIATIPVGTNPVGVAVTPDGKTVYVTNEGDGTVSVINTATNTVTGSAIDVDCPLTEVDCGRATGNKPTGIAVTPDGNKVFVGNLGGYYSIIATATNTVTSCLCFGPFPVPTSGVAVSPDGSVVFFVALGTENVFIVLYGGGVGNVFGIAGALQDIAIAPDFTIYVTDPVDDAVWPRRGFVFNPITVGFNPQGISVTADNSKVYVANEGGTGDGTVSVIATASDTVVATITVGKAPIAFGNFIQSQAVPNLFVGTPGSPNCHGTSVSALAQQSGGLAAAARANGFASVSALQNAITGFCAG